MAPAIALVTPGIHVPVGSRERDKFCDICNVLVSSVAVTLRDRVFNVDLMVAQVYGVDLMRIRVDAEQEFCLSFRSIKGL